jgi:hypothetical protein
LNDEKKGEIISTPIEKIVVHDIHINIDNKNVIFDEIEDIPNNKLPYIHFAISKASNNPYYLVGNGFFKSSIIKGKRKTLSNVVTAQLSWKTYNDFYVKNYPTILDKNSFISQYRQLLNDYVEEFANIASKHENDKKIEEIAFIVRVTFNGETKPAHEFIQCLNEVDEMYLQSSYVKDRGYSFTKSFYSMFNYDKFITNGVATKEIDSIPYFNKKNFLSLYYARNVYDTTSFIFGKDYSISIFPNYKDLSIHDIKTLTFKGKDVFDLDFVCNTVQTFINNHIERNPEEEKLIPIFLKFDIYYRYRNSNAGFQNMLKLSGVRYLQLLKIRDKINNEYYPSYKDKKTGAVSKRKLYYMLTDLYQDYNGKSEKWYATAILRTLQNIYQEKYNVPQAAEFCLLDRCEHLARLNKDDGNKFKRTWNKLFNIYKFLKTMENKNFMPELTTNPSYKLGAELAKFESEWRRGRENLKKTVNQFGGNISRTVYVTQDVRDYYNDLIERMKRNRIYIEEHNDLIFLLHTIKDNELEKNQFIFGYNTEKCNYFSKTNNEKKTEISVSSTDELLDIEEN